MQNEMTIQRFVDGAVVGEIGYGYDKSGDRILLSRNGVILTNSVSPGYRITAVKDASNGSVEESYSIDSGGRVTGMTRPGTTLSLGYNTADQVRAATNGANWIVYGHDAAGRRTTSTNSAGVVRRMLVAPTPGTELESPLLIANMGGTLQQGYVYSGDRPLMRFDAGGASSRVYYLEDGMGSVIGLAPAGSPSPANTTTLFYDGFETIRLTNGPAPFMPAGTGGDFRFHAAWLEEFTSLYNMRAREYDPRTGRFTSRDPSGGEFWFPETLNPYTFANNNPSIQSDPAGLFSLPEISISTLIQEFLAGLKAAGLNYVKSFSRQKLQSFFVQQFTDLIGAYLPSNFDPLKYINGGLAFEALIKDMLCSVDFGWFHFEVGVNQGDGRPVDNGLGCHQGKADLPHPRRGIRRPDVIIGPRDLVAADHSANKEWLIIEIKLREEALASYAGSRKAGQLDAILKYAANYQFVKVAAFVALTKGKPQTVALARKLIADKAAKQGVTVFVGSLQGGRRLKK